MCRPDSKRRHRRLASILTTAALAACAPLPPAAGTRPAWRPSPNFDARKASFVILHHTGDDSSEAALRTLTDPARRVSAHYLIGRDGSVVQLVAEHQRAWHAGASSWGDLGDLNSASIGIELDNNGQEPFAEAQILALVALLREIAERQGIPPANVLGHGDIAPRRKSDPSAFFPWQRLAAAGFGRWCDAPAAAPTLDVSLGLQAFGYDVSDLDAAILAFKRHFAPDDPAPTMAPQDIARLRCLLDQKAAR